MLNNLEVEGVVWWRLAYKWGFGGMLMESLNGWEESKRWITASRHSETFCNRQKQKSELEHNNVLMVGKGKTRDATDQK